MVKPIFMVRVFITDLTKLLIQQHRYTYSTPHICVIQWFLRKMITYYEETRL